MKNIQFSHSVSPTVEILPYLLIAKNKYKYRTIIEKAKRGVYHDFKSDMCSPKAKLHADLKKFPELDDILKLNAAGAFDDAPF